MCWVRLWLNHSHADIEPYCTPTDSGFWFKLFHVLDYCVSPLHLQWMYFLRDSIITTVGPKQIFHTSLHACSPQSFRPQTQTALAEFSQPAWNMFTKTSKNTQCHLEQWFSKCGTRTTSGTWASSSGTQRNLRINIHQAACPPKRFFFYCFKWERLFHAEHSGVFFLAPRI